MSQGHATWFRNTYMYCTKLTKANIKIKLIPFMLSVHTFVNKCNPRSCTNVLKYLINTVLNYTLQRVNK